MVQPRFSALFISVLLPLLGILTCIDIIYASPSTTNNITAHIESALQTRMATAAPHEQISFIIHLKEKAKITSDDLPTSKLARRTTVVQQLKETAASSQAPLITHLQTLQQNNQLSHYEPLWIINAIAARGPLATIQSIAARPEIQRISLDAQIQLFQPITYNGMSLSALPAIGGSDGPGWGVERIGTPYAWHGLGIDGQGVTVAIMDSGVTWQHPDLYPNYRGNLGGGQIDHNGNWYDASNPDNVAPSDPIGHGTHVAGSAIGQNGIGVAPGAQWIAVKIGDDNGQIAVSDIHEGFQWLLAPDDDPALAPDIVNGSWSDIASTERYKQDLDMLHAAGIMTVFAVGNTGPGPGTAETPANYTDTLSVGASDDIDGVAWFSSRGPSFITGRTNPDLVAPGTHILSTWLDGGYAYQLGTSMAAPHVSGAAALALSANPNLTPVQLRYILTNTAVSLAPNHPNNSSGWGRLDAYAATRSQTNAGSLRGLVQGQEMPLADVTLTITTPSGIPLTYVTDANGNYRAYLQPGIYQLAASRFGYQSARYQTLIVTPNQDTWLNIDLTPLPTGTIQGVVRQTGSNLPLTATITISGTPVTAVSEANGQYSLSVPPGTYQLIANANSHRLGEAMVTLTQEQNVTQNFQLDPGPAIVLIDAGQWYYDSFVEYYQNSLTQLGYPYDMWTVRSPQTDVPMTADLTPYDYAIWSDPFLAPGRLFANRTITGFLDAGGHLLVSGQNVGNIDGSGFTTQPWWLQKLQALFIDETAVTHTLTGLDNTYFNTLSFHLNGGTSANNQVAPDQVTPRAGSLTQPILQYGEDSWAGLQAGDCTSYRLVYFGFGLEGVREAEDRRQLLQSSFDYFQSPRLETGVQWRQADIDDFAVPGTHLTYTFSIQNLSETVTDTFTLTALDATWPTVIVTPTLTLGPCAIAQMVLTMTVPANAPRDSHHNVRLTAVSNNTPGTIDQLSLHHKIPGRILLVDDDRWYERRPIYTSALDHYLKSYDVWDVGWFQIGLEGRGSPPGDLLNQYDIVIWYTGYDWLSPITVAEEETLYNYLAQGGRLFLSSQDYLFYHPDNPLTRDFLGVIDHQEPVTPTQLYAVPDLSSQLAGPLPLDYGPYLNFSDAIWPAANSQPYWWHNRGLAALTNEGVTNEGERWRSNFWAVPFEVLSSTFQSQAMNHVIGYLSDLGDSTFEASTRSLPANTPVAYTITLRTLADAPTNQVWLTNTLPAGLQLLPDSLTGPASYNAATHQIVWQGDLSGGTSEQISYQAMPSPTLLAGSQLDNHLTLAYARHQLRFEQMTSVWLEAPDLSASALEARYSPAQPELVTYTLSLQNNDLISRAVPVTAVLYLPHQLTPLTPTLHISGGSAYLYKRTITWTGYLSPEGRANFSLVLTRTLTAEPTRLTAVADLQDGTTATVLRPVLTQLSPPHQIYFPFMQVVVDKSQE